MSKPFELTVYPHWEDDLNGTCYSTRDGLGFPINVDYWILCKQLDDAELAAELWFAVSREAHAEAMGWRTGHAPDWINTNQEECRIVGILERFAALPHASETDYR
jgi:hypothetical protein